ncbi:SWIM zinc finger family protein [Porphyromonas macacae]|uniref:SWIM zinc finger family protein n=1 Tax=Porphyromonas macacae TaxID=28115 RepID=UPI00373FC9A7
MNELGETLRHFAGLFFAQCSCPLFQQFEGGRCIHHIVSTVVAGSRTQLIIVSFRLIQFFQDYLTKLCQFFVRVAYYFFFAHSILFLLRLSIWMNTLSLADVYPQYKVIHIQLCTFG